MSRLADLVHPKSALLGFGFFLSMSLMAQTAAHQLASSAATDPKPFSLQPPAPKSPVDLFRSLLVMSPADRREFISKRSPEAQKSILAKIQEYERLKPEQRDLRLLVTELRWYLLPLLNAAPTNRTTQLAEVPDALRPLVQARLQEWDKLSTQVQKELLENESTVRFYFELAARSAAQRSQAVTNMTAAAQQQIGSGLRRWQALSQEQRQGIIHNFYEFFELTSAEKDKTLKTLSEPERLQIEKTLNTFGGLTPALRAQCLRSFEKFASLTPEERQQFLRNAERWERMTPSERQSWRNLVSTFSHEPPLPPGFHSPPAPMPPSPTSMRPKGAASLVTQTN